MSLRLQLLAATCAALSSFSLSADDWPLHGLDYAASRSSPLADIHTGNVQLLEPAFTVSTGMKGAFQATPIVVEGTLYVSTPWNDVLAVDAATGEERWRYRHDMNDIEPCCGPANRGVAVSRGRVVMATVDNRLIALDASRGTVLWDTAITNDDPGVREAMTPLLGDTAFADAVVTGGTGYTANMAPQVFDGKVYVGISGTGYGLHLDKPEGGAAALSVVGLSGGQHGLRGFLACFDLDTGRELWRWYSVPEQGWEGAYAEAAPDGLSLNRDLAAERGAAERWPASWRIGGGSIWSTPAVDDQTRTIFFGTGNPAPQMDDSTRPGDNLHTASLIALDADSGALRWAFQLVPHDRWGYDTANPPILHRWGVGDAARPAVSVASKTGQVYTLDRRTGELLARSAAFVPQFNLYAQPTATGVTVAPAILGGATWSPSAYDERTGHFFVEGIHHPATYFEKPLEASEGQPWTQYTYMELSTTERGGTLSALDLATGSMVWQRRSEAPLVGGLLHTAGGLIFHGEGDGRFLASDAASGRTLWSWQGEAGVNAPPITYRAAGRQFVAVAAGGNPLFGFPGGDRLLVFSLPVATSADGSSP
jgi:glucose dehydrogenase